LSHFNKILILWVSRLMVVAAIDRKFIVDTMFKGEGVLETGSFYAVAYDKNLGGAIQSIWGLMTPLDMIYWK